ncbi:ABC transporter permease [Novosphingobium sp. FSY-8]|uniref:ABC transporter permease n=1 Tax=Novosphingobium ovatum TaxID=1908523 RepID=A0ABW9XED0_9SPHN|nr:ABC transporter permease [Novosphingobium ovatum]NBC36898.1 ABC transporter permease [Novosphingobium ovatum]
MIEALLATTPALNRAALRRAIAVQRRVIWALMLRETLTRYGRHNIGFLWLFVEPMLFTLGVTALWHATGMTHGSQLPIMAFALTGYSTILLWRNMPGRCVGAVGANLPLLYHRHVRVADIFLSRVALEAAGATMSFTLLGLVLIAGEWIDPPEDFLLLAWAWALTAWFGAALALMLGSLAEGSEWVEKLWHPAAYLLFPLSGAAFLMDALPADFQAVLGWIPMVHCTEMIRAAWFGSQIVPHYDTAYLVACNLGLSLMGLANERRLSRSAVPE